MNPLPKSAGWVAVVVAILGSLGAILQIPEVQALIQAYPKISATLAAVTVIVAALSHSLPGDGGDGSKPVN